jgi:sugar-specific transcriptional regulator TrmB
MKDAIHELIGIGLTEYDSRVYYALLQQSPPRTWRNRWKEA